MLPEIAEHADEVDHQSTRLAHAALVLVGGSTRATAWSKTWSRIGLSRYMQ